MHQLNRFSDVIQCVHYKNAKLHKDVNKTFWIVLTRLKYLVIKKYYIF